MSEVRLIDANALFNWGKYKLSDAVKYGNKDEEQQHFSYGTLMMYEVADEIADAPTIAPDKEITHLRAKLKEADEHIEFDNQLVKRLEREKDALQAKLDEAVEVILHECGENCKHYKESDPAPWETYPCSECLKPNYNGGIYCSGEKWQWRGTEEI